MGQLQKTFSEDTLYKWLHCGWN